MKRISQLLILVLFAGLLIGAQSCVVISDKDQGRHNGLYKSSSNPRPAFRMSPSDKKKDHQKKVNPGKKKGHYK